MKLEIINDFGFRYPFIVPVSRLLQFQENAFSSGNKSALESTVNFLTALSGGDLLPATLKTDAHHCLRLLTADLCEVSDLTSTLQQLDALKKAEDGESLGSIIKILSKK